MSGSWYEHLADTWQDSKIDGLGYLNPQEIAEDVMKNDSRAVESVAKKWNLPWLEQEAHGNVSDPAKGIGKASTAVGLGYLGANAGQWLGGMTGGGYVDQIGNAAEGAMAGAQTKAGLLGMGGDGGYAKKYAMQQMMNQMSPQQAPQAPARPFVQQQEQMRNPYAQQQYQDPMANLTEEDKMKLRAMGYQV